MFLGKFVRFQMGGFVNQRFSCVVLGVAGGLALVPSARGVTAEYNGQGLEAQGFRGPISLPFAQQIPSPFNGLVAGASASNSRLYSISNGSSPTSTSTLAIEDAQTGFFLSGVTLSTRLSDIAFTNGQLYGIEANTGSIQIVSVSDTGVIQPVATQAATTTNVVWRLSGAVNGDSLFAMAVPGFGSFGSPGPAYTIDPVSSSVTPFTFTKPAGSQAQDSVINLAGNTVTVIGLSTQSTYSYPGGVFQGNLPPLSQYFSTTSSDEFTYNYGPSQPAFADLGLTGNTNFGHDGLFRLPASFVATPLLSNGIAPDGVTLSNVSIAPGVQALTQVSGPATANVAEVPQAPGAFSFRSLGMDTISLPGVRGTYQFAISANALVGDYTQGTTIIQGRGISNVANPPIITVAVDPVSSNLVGNGDFSLGSAGWESGAANTGSTPFYSNFNVRFSTQGVELSTSPGVFYAVRQFLELPTASVPMELSFTYSVNPAFGTTSELQAYLGGELVGDVTATASPQTFQTVITDPSLENLVNAELRFEGIGGSTIAYIDNISLTPIPEPAWMGMVGIGCAWLLLRRRGTRLPRYTPLNGT
jgi:hypothetical protein